MDQDQAVEYLKSLKKLVADHSNTSTEHIILINTILELVESVGWCDQHGRPRLPVGVAPCSECIEEQNTMTKFEAEHGPDRD